jgi:LacI family transcriptional regulator
MKKKAGTNVQASAPKAHRRVSQQDIAREAGVSRVTVSLVLSGKDQTSQETRQRVLQAAERLKYRPNLLVQGMQTGRTHAVGILMPATTQFQSQIAHGIHDELVIANYVPVMLWTNPSPAGRATELEQIHRLVDRRIDGIILWPADVSVPDVHFHEIWERQIPLVTVDRETTTHADHVGTDEELGGRMAAEHLLKLGHAHVAHVSREDPVGAPLTRRREAFVRRVQELGGRCRIVYGTDDGVTPLLQDLLAMENRPTAIFASSDVVAMKVYKAAAAAGLRIPDDLSVVGYADFAFAPDLVPALTTIRQDPYHIGRTAGQMMLDRIFSRAAKRTPIKAYLKPELILRNSTGSLH